MAIYDGTAGDDNISGGSTADVINGNAGNDTLQGNAGNDAVDGGAGTDTVRFRGTFSDYVITWDAAARRYRIRDTRTGRDGSDMVWGVEYFRFLNGTWSIANLVAGTGDGLVLSGTVGNDVFTGDIGYDILMGGEGDDVLEGRGANDTLTGGAGADTAVYHGNFAEYRITWDAAAGKFTIVDTVANRDGTDTVKEVESFAFADGTRDHLDLSGVILTGTAGDDQLEGRGAGDTLSGLAGNDTLRGGAGDDALDGGDDVDTAVFRGNFAEYQVAWDSAARRFTVVDTVAHRDGTDTLDQVEYLAFADGTRHYLELTGVTLTGTEGDDELEAGSGDDTLIGLAGYDTLHGGTGNDVLDGGGGGDFLSGMGGDDRIIGGEGYDAAWFSGSRSSYAVSWDAGTRSYTIVDKVAGRDGTDVVSGVEWFSFAGASLTLAQLLPNEGDGVQLTGTSAPDGLVGGEGFDTLLGLEGNDSLDGHDANDFLDAGAGDDILRGGRGNDRIIGGTGTDLLLFSGARENYTVTWDDSLRQYTITDTRGASGDGVDTVSGIEYFGFSGGALSINQLLPEAGDGWEVTGTDGDEVLQGDMGFDILRGLGGADRLVGAAAGDLLEGGAGDDMLVGGSGNDRIDGGEGVDSAEFADSRSAYTVTWESASRTYRIRNARTGETDVVSDVEFFRFRGGFETLGIDELRPDAGDGELLVGTAGDDQLVGGQGLDTLQGLDGNDLLDGGSADDLLEGGAGDDVLRGGGGNDRVVGGQGRDRVEFSGYRHDYAVTWDAASRSYTIVDHSYRQNNGTDVVSGVEEFSFRDGTFRIHNLISGASAGDGEQIIGTAGADVLVGGVGFDSLQGLEGDDQLSGGEAEDLLQGGEGNDWLAGDFGNDTLEGGAGDDVLRGGFGNDRIVGGAGRDRAEFAFRRSDFTVSWDAASRSYTIIGRSFTDPDIGQSQGDVDIVTGVEQFAFSDGVYTIADLVPGAETGDGVVLTGTAGDDFLQGETGFDTLQGLAGNEQLWGSLGGDVLQGGEGNDWLDGGDGNDTLEGGAGDDILVGGRGNDRIDGGAGRDSVQFSGYRSDFTVSWDAASRSYTIASSNPFGGEGNDVVSGVEQFQFWDGVYGIADLVPGAEAGDGVVLVGTAGDDFLYGQSGFDTLQGLEGNDHLHGGRANDVLEGGAGDDTLWGDAGNDSLDGGEGSFDGARFSGNSWEYVVSWDAQRRVYTLADTVAGRDGVDTVAGVEFFYFQDRVSGWGNLVPGEGDGLQLTGTDGDDVLYGSDGYDTIHGGAGNDTLGGGGGRDVLDGGDGDDTIDGGAGHRIDGGAGTDTVSFHGYLHDHAIAWDAATGRFSFTSHYWEPGTVTYASNIEYLRFFDGTIDAWSALGGTWPGQHLVGSEQGDYLVATQGNDVLDGLGGADTLRAERGDDVLNGGEGDDLLVGSAGNDVLDGGAGHDRTIYYGTRSEYTITWDAGTQRFTIADTVAGRDGTDVVSGVEQFSFNYSEVFTDAQLRGEPGADATLHGSAIMDWLQGGPGNETLLGFEGDDTLHGAEGQDVLDGGQGNDLLQGGADADVFVLRGEGLDFIPSFVGGQDRIRLARPLFAGMGTGTLAPGAFQAAQHDVPGSADVRILLNLANGHLLYDPDGFGGAAAVELAVLDAPGILGTPSAADFHVG